MVNYTLAPFNKFNNTLKQEEQKLSDRVEFVYVNAS